MGDEIFSNNILTSIEECGDLCASILISSLPQSIMVHSSIEPKKWYSAAGAAPLLMVTQETVKAYCRQGTLKAKQVGPKKIWHVLGKSILKLREQWKIDD